MQKNCSKKLIGLGYFIPLLFLLTFFYLSRKISVSAADGINEEINLQGKLVDSDGTNFSGDCASSCNFQFTIYETCSGTPNQVWQETQGGVSVTDGIFNAKLGSSTSLSSIDFNDNDMCLRVELDADGAGGTYEENFGTVPLNSVPTAFNSKYLAGQAGSSYLRSNASDNYTSGTLTLDAGTTLDINGDLTVSDQTAVFDAASYTAFDLTGDLRIFATGDDDDYIYFNTNTNVPGIFWEGITDPDPAIYTTGTELGYRDEGGSWVSFDSLDGGTSRWQLTGNVVHPTLATYDIAVGGTTLVSPFSVDEGSNTVRIGEGSGSNGTLSIYSSSGDSGNLTFSSGRFEINKNLEIARTGTLVLGFEDFDSGNDDFNIQVDSSQFSIIEEDAGTTRFIIDTDGNIGIGVTDPSALLDIGASTTSRASLQIVTGTAPSSPNTGDMYVASGNLYFYNGGSWDDLTSTVGAGSVGTGELKTATSGTSGTITGGGGTVNIQMQDYCFSPNIGVSASVIMVEAYTAQNADTIGRFRLSNSGVPNRTYDVRWRYVTASHDPEIFTWYDTVNNIITNIYQAEIEVPQTFPLEIDPIPANWIPIQATIYEDSLSKLGDDNQTTYIMKNYRFKSYAKASDLPENDLLKASPVKSDTVFITHPDIYYGELEYCGQPCADKWDELYKDKDLGPSEETGADIAEYYDGQDDIQAGDIVSVDQSQSFFLTKSITEYDSKALGIISTSPGQVIGDNQIGDLRLALTGRVPVKVSNINGPINSGNPITSSHIPATGMKATKAGQIVAKALEAFNPDQAVPCLDNPEYKCGKILAFINVGWFEPQSYLDSLDQIISDYNTIINSTGSIDVLENLTITNTLTAAAIQAQDGLFSNIQVGDAMISNNLTINGLLTSKQIKAGALEAFDSENIIIQLTESLGKTAFAIENSLGESVFSVDSAGKISIKSDTEDASVGSTEFEIGITEVEISTTAVNENSKVFVSPSSTLEDIPLLGIMETGEGYFKVNMDKVRDRKVKFHWWVIN